MADDAERLDDKLSTLEASILAGDRAAVLDHYLAFDAELTRYVRGEERLLFPVLERFTSTPIHATDTMRTEHRSLRRLLESLGELIARADKQRGLDVLTTLRIVLLLHVAKEESLLHPLMRPAIARRS
jgi:iron-sulfur cluster repair protein YtfE (RIC family)